MRQKISNTVEQRLLAFFRTKRCVVTGDENAEWHHLDDDPTNSVFENILPLGSNLNSPALRDARLRADKGNLGALNGQLAPRSLIQTAAWWFNVNWKTANAYACARLAFHVADRYRR